MVAQRKRKTKNPCPRCGLHLKLCICLIIPNLPLKTKIILVIHAKELKRTTNTGRLALAALPNSEMKVRGDKASPLDLSHLEDANYTTLLLYPAADAQVLDENYRQTLTKPVQLIVPDGNWRQAGKVHLRHPELATYPRVMLNQPNLATQHLRAETSSFGMSTLEAIARAIGILEGRDAEAALLRLYQAKLKNTLLGRGKNAL